MAVAHQKQVKASADGSITNGTMQVAVIAYGMDKPVAEGTYAKLYTSETGKAVGTEDSFYDLFTCSQNTGLTGTKVPRVYGPIRNDAEELGGGYNDRAGVDIQFPVCDDTNNYFNMFVDQNSTRQNEQQSAWSQSIVVALGYTDGSGTDQGEYACCVLAPTTSRSFVTKYRRAFKALMTRASPRSYTPRGEDDATDQGVGFDLTYQNEDPIHCDRVELDLAYLPNNETLMCQYSGTTVWTAP